MFGKLIGVVKGAVQFARIHGDDILKLIAAAGSLAAVVRKGIEHARAMVGPAKKEWGTVKPWFGTMGKTAIAV